MSRRPSDSGSTAAGCLFWLVCLFLAWVFVMTVVGLLKIAIGAA